MRRRLEAAATLALALMAPATTHAGDLAGFSWRSTGCADWLSDAAAVDLVALESGQPLVDAGQDAFRVLVECVAATGAARVTVVRERAPAVEISRPLGLARVVPAGRARLVGLAVAEMFEEAGEIARQRRHGATARASLALRRIAATSAARAERVAATWAATAASSRPREAPTAPSTIGLMVGGEGATIERAWGVGPTVRGVFVPGGALELGLGGSWLRQTVGAREGDVVLERITLDASLGGRGALGAGWTAIASVGARGRSGAMWWASPTLRVEGRRDAADEVAFGIHVEAGYVALGGDVVTRGEPLSISGPWLGVGVTAGLILDTRD